MEELHKALLSVNQLLEEATQPGMEMTKAEVYMALGIQNARNILEAQLYWILFPTGNYPHMVTWAVDGRKFQRYI